MYRYTGQYLSRIIPNSRAPKAFFDARQKEGQSAIEFREDLLSLIEEADGVNIGVDNLMLQIGFSDPSFQRELGAVRNPTLVAFSKKIECFEQARRTISSTMFGNVVSRSASSSNSSHRNPGPNSRPANRSSPPRGRGERD